ncbi:SURF1 family cytochrome oxidase biogenesis protein [Cellulomonas sp. ATA003]|uniref:SURF1 family cytochrome oxidase biogenesis protein n=1 Tax=Cellulomonas sp. ATA003 TaxID=3073064 RepID=UPI002873108C|nr:SURF1 family cytochrome oxidase biogenesis protein [Cellulomonas sp. ATA003]WNB86055.1 SURF1 family cytochrome oxidase biogenesis protein [Cellulomonas sp. ATA003]
MLAVVRGWVESPDDVGDVPSGPVELTGYLQAAEAAGALDAAGGRAEAISAAQLVNVWGGPIYSGYLVLATSQPSQDAALEPLGPPQPRGGSGWDLRNLGYALQWWIFGLFAVALWLRLVRDEARGELPPGEELPDGIVAGGSSGEGPSGESPSGEGVADPDVAGEDAGRDRSVRGPADADASA